MALTVPIFMMLTINQYILVHFPHTELYQNEIKNEESRPFTSLSKVCLLISWLYETHKCSGAFHKDFPYYIHLNGSRSVVITHRKSLTLSMLLSLIRFSQIPYWLNFVFVKNSYTKFYKNTVNGLLANTRSLIDRQTCKTLLFLWKEHIKTIFTYLYIPFTYIFSVILCIYLSMVTVLTEVKSRA
jgi:hypothetical protein